jgi:cyclopropane fatty-acyl-phospholipid synthase-like methyltransferase
MAENRDLSSKMEPFSSFWEAPNNIEKGYIKFNKFYRRNYLRRLSLKETDRVLSISCGYGYFLSLLNELGVKDAEGIDSDPDKIAYAKKRGFNVKSVDAFEFLEKNNGKYDLIFAEQEINHLAKEEIIHFFLLCKNNLVPNGKLVVHSLNGANPITGSEALAQNFDHQNTFTEYSLKQIFEHTDYKNIRIFPLNLYIFYENPLNIIGIAIDTVLNLIFRVLFIFYGKSNRYFSKKIGAIGHRN